MSEQKWKLVPVELTGEMRNATSHCESIDEAWRAMLAAAPQPPAIGNRLQVYGSMRSVLGGISGLCWEWIDKPAQPALHAIDAVLVDRAHVAELQAEVERLKQLACDRKDQQTEMCTQINDLEARNAELEGLLRDVQPTIKAVADDEGMADFKEAESLLARIDAALAGRECCTPTAEERASLAAGDCTPEELWGGSRPTCPKCHDNSKALAGGKEHGPHWRDPETAPKDGTLLCLLVEFSEHSTEDEEQAPTIGANNFDNDGLDEWKFAGWCWSHDHFVQGIGKVVGWLPFIDQKVTEGADHE